MISKIYDWFDLVGTFAAAKLLPMVILTALGILVIQVVTKLVRKVLAKSKLEKAAHVLITSLAKTRDTYVAYRKAGYSKKFLAEHEADITLHKAAKKHFDELGIQKLPTVKSLQAEYAALMEEKKAAYAEYRKAREDMKELLTAKANIDRILELDEVREEPNGTKEKEAEQR